MVPSGDHAPERPIPVSATTNTCPPVTSTFFNWLREEPPKQKKPSQRLSADQNGNQAPSVPGSSLSAGESSERTHNMVLPAVSSATYVIQRPFGDTARYPE